MDLTAIRTGLKDTLSTISGLNVTDLCDNPLPPCVMVYPEAPFQIDLAFEHGLQMPRFIVMVLVPYIDTPDAQEQMDTFLGTTGDNSIIAAISADQTLGGAVSEAAVTELKSYGIIELSDGGTRYLNADLAVEIYSS